MSGPLDLAAFRRTLIAEYAAMNRRPPGAVLVDGSVYVEHGARSPDFCAVFEDNERAAAALTAAGWVPYGNSTIAFFPERREIAAKRGGESDKRYWEEGKVVDWANAL